MLPGGVGTDLAVTQHVILPRRVHVGDQVIEVTKIRNRGPAPAVGVVARELPQYAEAEDPLNRRIQHDCAMCRCPVQVNRGAEDRHLGDKRRHDERNNQGKEHDATLRQTRLLLGNPMTCGGCQTKPQW